MVSIGEQYSPSPLELFRTTYLRRGMVQGTRL